MRYTLTRDEYVESQMAYRVRLAKGRALFRNLYGIAAATALLGVYMCLSGSRWVGIVLFVVAAVCVAERLSLSRRRAALFYNATSSLREPVELQIQESNLLRTTPSGPDEIRWANIEACHETRNLFLLLLDTKELLVIPKRAFSSADLFAFNNLRQKELIVKTTRENPDLVLLRFVVSWGVLALAFMVLSVGYVHTFFSQLPQNPRTIRPASRTPKPPSRPASLPELRGSGVVYLVPLGTVHRIAVPQLVADLQKRYRLPLLLLPAIQVPDWALNSTRKQYVAEDLIAAIKLAYPKEAADPDAVIIGLTDEDMYISSLRWTYAFSLREEERFAVISSARLSQGVEGDKPVSEQFLQQLLQQRVSKVLTRDVGILYYRLQPSNSYRSVLYNSVDDPSDLDDIGDDFLKEDASVRAELHVEQGDPCFIIRHYNEPERKHPESGIIASCSGYYKELNLETVQIDLRYGLLLDQRTDFLAADSIPLELTRVLRTQDSRSRAFGIGGNHSLNLFLVGDKWPFTYIDLVLADGGRAHFRRSNWGFGYWDAHYTNRDTNGTRYAGSTIDWGWPGWKLKGGGLTYKFPDAARATRPEQGALVGIQNYRGSQLMISRDADGHLLRAHSPAGKELVFQYDSKDRVIEIDQKDGGRFKYEYDSTGHLANVVDDRQRAISYTYDQAGNLNRIVQDGAEICSLTYDSHGRVQSEILPDGRTYGFRYSSNSQLPISQVDISDSAGPKRTLRISFVEYSLDVRP